MRTEALDDTIARKAISYILGMKDTFLKKDSSEGRQYSVKRGEAIWDNKKTDELLLFRDLARGIRLDARSEAAVRQPVFNITSLDEKVKSKYLGQITK